MYLKPPEDLTMFIMETKRGVLRGSGRTRGEAAANAGLVQSSAGWSRPEDGVPSFLSTLPSSGEPCPWRSQTSALEALRGAPSPCTRGVLPGQPPRPPPWTRVHPAGVRLQAGHGAVHVLRSIACALGLVSNLAVAPWILGCLLSVLTELLQCPRVKRPSPKHPEYVL